MATTSGDSTITPGRGLQERPWERSRQRSAAQTRAAQKAARDEETSKLRRTAAQRRAAQKAARDEEALKRSRPRPSTQVPLKTPAATPAKAPATAPAVKAWSDILFGGAKPSKVNNGFWAPPPPGVTYSAGAHTGVDFSMPAGTSVHIPTGGVVTKAGFGAGGKPLGGYVEVRMPDGHYMTFSHLSKISVLPGQKLDAGVRIGAVGSTGNSTGNHLHLEVRTPASGGRFGTSKSYFTDPIAYLNQKTTAKHSFGQGVLLNYTDPNATGTGSDNGNGAGPGATVGGDGGAGAGVGAAFSKKDFYAYLSASFGDIDTLLRLDKEAQAELGGKSIKWAIDQLVKKKITDPSIALTYLNQTGWFKKYSQETSQRLILEESKPDQAKQQLTEIASNMSTYLNGLGVKVPPELVANTARQAWLYGWSNEQIIDHIQGTGNWSIDGGDIGAAVEELHSYADDFGVTLQDAELTQVYNEMMDGLGISSARERIQEQAANRYAVFADRIRAGESVKSVTAAYWDVAAQLLETSPDALSWNDPLFAGGAAFTKVDPTTGQQVQKTLAEFEKDLRADPRWLKTRNAKDEITGLGYDMLKRFGMVG